MTSAMTMSSWRSGALKCLDVRLVLLIRALPSPLSLSWCIGVLVSWCEALLGRLALDVRRLRGPGPGSDLGSRGTNGRDPMGDGCGWIPESVLLRLFKQKCRKTLKLDPDTWRDGLRQPARTVSLNNGAGIAFVAAPEKNDSLQCELLVEIARGLACCCHASFCHVGNSQGHDLGSHGRRRGWPGPWPRFFGAPSCAIRLARWSSTRAL